jgi:hypothetical protein
LQSITELCSRQLVVIYEGGRTKAKARV